MPDQTWVLLLYALPTKQGTHRVSLWRKLKKIGAVSLKTSAYLLPDRPEHYEHFQWLAQQVRDAGGEATLIRATVIEGMAEKDVIEIFDRARGEDYADLVAPLQEILKRNKKRVGEGVAEQLEKLKARFEEIRRIDFFNCAGGEAVEALLKRARALWDDKDAGRKLATKEFSGRSWLTRPRPEIDRVGSAWLIRKFIDPKARFIFSSDRAAHPEALAYDMVDADFTHHGEDCTFETLVKRFGIADKAVRRIAEMVHDADLEDDKFSRGEGLGIQRTLQGWGLLGLSDEELLGKGGECFDALYALAKRER